MVSCNIQHFLFCCISLMIDGSQRARLPLPPTATLPSCLWSPRIFPSLPGSHLKIVYRDASSSLLQLVNELFNDWGERGYDDSVPGEVIKTAPSGDRTTGSPTWSASLPRIQLIPPGSWSDMSPAGAIFVTSPPKTGTNLLHPLSLLIVGRVQPMVEFFLLTFPRFPLR